MWIHNEFSLATPPPATIGPDLAVPNDTPMPYTFPMSQVNATQAPGGTYKVVDSRTFPVSTTVCGVEVTVEVGGMRFVIVVLIRLGSNHLRF